MNKYLTTLVVVAVVLTGAYYLLFTNPEVQPAPTPTSTAETIKVGLLFPLSGDLAGQGEAALAGAQVAIKEINEGGGVNGRQIEAFFEDDRCSKDGGVAAATKLIITDQITALIGSLCDSAVTGENSVAQAAGVPMLIVGATGKDLTQAGDFVFRPYLTDAAEGKAAADQLFSVLKKKKAAVVNVQGDASETISQSFASRFKELGGTIAVSFVLDNEGKEVKTAVSKIKAGRVEAIYAPVSPSLAAAFLQKLREAKLTTVFLGSSQWEGSHFGKEAERMYYPVFKASAWDSFQQNIQTATGKQANIATLFVYDAMRLLAETMKQSGTDKKSLRTALASVYFDKSAAMPAIEFNEARELRDDPSFWLKQVLQGKAELLPPPKESSSTTSSPPSSH